MPSPPGDIATVVFAYAVSPTQGGNPVQTTVEVPDPPSFFTGNKSDSVQLSPVNATKTPEAR